MQTIDNYILERLNPKHLGSTPSDLSDIEIGQCFEIPGRYTVTLETWLLVTSSNWMCGLIPRRGRGTILCFWTPDSNNFLYTEDVFQNSSQYGFKFFIADVINHDEIKKPDFFERIKSHFDAKKSVDLEDIRIAQHLKLPDRFIKIVEQFKDKYCK